MIPVISNKIDWEKALSYASLQAITVDNKPGKALSVWEMSFSQNEGEIEEFYCVMDASTYKIYEINITGENCVAEFQDAYIRHIKETGLDEYSYTLQCVNEYWSYLKDEDSKDIEVNLSYDTELYDDTYKKIVSEVYTIERSYLLQFYWSYNDLPFLQIKWLPYYDENINYEKELQGW